MYQCAKKANLVATLLDKLLPKIAQHFSIVLKVIGLGVERTVSVIADVVAVEFKPRTSRNRNVVVKVLLLLSNQTLQML
jgi:hypothetical protein